MRERVRERERERERENASIYIYIYTCMQVLYGNVVEIYITIIQCLFAIIFLTPLIILPNHIKFIKESTDGTITTSKYPNVCICFTCWTYATKCIIVRTLHISSQLSCASKTELEFFVSRGAKLASSIVKLTRVIST